MAEGMVFEVELRSQTGTGAARAVRNAGRIPAVLYGGPRGSVSVSLERKAVAKALEMGKFLSHAVTISHKGEKQSVIVKVIDFHPVTDRPEHIDLFRIEEGALITVEVPVHFKNHETCTGLKRGGALNIDHHKIEVVCPGDAIPEELVIDLAGMDIGKVIHVNDLVFPANVTPTSRDPHYTIASITGRGSLVTAAEE